MHHHRHRHGQRHCLSPSLSLSCYVRMAPYWGAHNRKLYIIVPQDTNKVSTMPVAETKHSEKERTFRRRKRQQKKSDCSTFYQLEVCGVWHKVTVDTPFLLPWNNNNKKKTILLENLRIQPKYSSSHFIRFYWTILLSPWILFLFSSVCVSIISCDS